MSYQETTESIFAIRSKLTGEFIKFGSKCAWATVGAAKNAWGLHMPKEHNQVDGFYQQRFDDQSEYEVVDVLKMYHNLKNGGI